VVIRQAAQTKVEALKRAITQEGKETSIRIAKINIKPA
jgi:hypothetical protein